MRKRALAGACVALVVYGINSVECAPNKLRRVDPQRGSVENVEDAAAAARHEGPESLETLSYPADPADDGRMRKKQKEVRVGTEQPDEDDEDAAYVSDSEEVEASEAEDGSLKVLKLELDAREKQMKGKKAQLLLAWAYFAVASALLSIFWKLALGHADADYYRMARAKNVGEFAEAAIYFRETHLSGNPLALPLLILSFVSIHSKIILLMRIVGFLRLYIPVYAWRTYQKYFQQADAF